VDPGGSIDVTEPGHIPRRSSCHSDETRALALTGLSVSVAFVAHWLSSAPVSLASLVLASGVAGVSPVAGISAAAASVGFVFEPIAFGSAHFSVTEVLVVAAIVGGAARLAFDVALRSERDIGAVIRRAGALAGAGFGPAALALGVVGLFSLVTVARPEFRHASIREFRWVVAEPIAFYFVARWYIRTRAQIVTVAAWFVAGATAVALSGILDLVRGTGLSVEGVTRVSGVYPHPNALALFLERGIVFAAVLASAFRTRLSARWAVAALPLAACLVLTFSRGALLAAGVGVVAGLLVGRRLRLATLVSAGGAVFLAVLAVVARQRITDLFSGGSGTLRLSLWHSSVEMIRDHPVFGVGLDQFLYVYAPRYVRPEAWPERFTSHPHDLILDLWLRLGIMGLAVAGLYLFLFTRSVRRLAKEQNALGVAAAAAILAGTLHGLVDNGYFLPDLALAFWLFSALIDVEAGTRIGGRPA
jgi:O-antigen ligase